MDKITKVFTRANVLEWHNLFRRMINEAYKETEKDLLVTIEEHKKNRSVEQNKLQRKWLKEAEAQGDMTAEEYRGYCKLHFGVAIAKENDDFAEKYDRLIKPFTYEQKLELMMVPIDMPVTRIMNTKQNHKYLNKIYEYLTGIGIALTQPKDPYWDEVLSSYTR